MIKVNIFYVSGFLLLPWPETFGLLIWSFNGGKSCFPLIVIRIIHVTLNTHWNCYFSATITILLVLWVTWRYIMHLTCLSVCASEIIYMFSIELHENWCMQIPFGDDCDVRFCGIVFVDLVGCACTQNITAGIWEGGRVASVCKMTLFSKFFYKRPPDGLLEFVDRVYGEYLHCITIFCVGYLLLKCVYSQIAVYILAALCSFRFMLLHRGCARWNIPFLFAWNCKWAPWRIHGF